MKIPKLPRFLVVSVLTLSMLTISLLALSTRFLPTQRAIADESEKLILTYKLGDKVVELEDSIQGYKEAIVKEHMPIPENMTLDSYAKYWSVKSLEYAAGEMANTYPKYEIIAINGKPWQETEWANLIKSKFMAEDKETGWVAYPPLLKELIFDPQLNGKGFEIDLLAKEGKTADEVRDILLKDSATVFGTVEQKETTKETTEKTTPVISETLSKDYQVVLTVGNKEGSEIREGVSRPVVFDTAPEILKESTLVPLRGVVDRFGATITWDAADSRATVTKEDKSISVQVNSNTARINGKETALTVPPVIKNGRVLIPLRLISEGIGLEVHWDAETNSIILKHPQKLCKRKVAQGLLFCMTFLEGGFRGCLKRKKKFFFFVYFCLWLPCRYKVSWHGVIQVYQG